MKFAFGLESQKVPDRLDNKTAGLDTNKQLHQTKFNICSISKHGFQLLSNAIQNEKYTTATTDYLKT